MQRIHLLSLFCILLIFAACEETEPGCLDFFSNNYDFEAISSCDSCCTYPQVNFDYNLIYGDTTLRINRDTFFLNEDSLVIKRLELVFSEFEFIGDADTYTVLDTIKTQQAQVNDDFVFVKTTENIGIGKTRFKDTLRKIKFRIGFNQDKLNALMPFANLNQASKLDGALDSLYNEVDDTYYTSRLSIQLDDSTRQIVLIDPVPNNQLTFDVVKEVEAGTAWEFVINLDVKILVTGINASMTNEEVKIILRDNLAQALVLE